LNYSVSAVYYRNALLDKYIAPTLSNSINPSRGGNFNPLRSFHI
jgi:hypothetical protein